MLELNQMVLLTLDRAQELRIPFHNLAQLVCVLYPEGGKCLAISVLSVRRMCELIDELAPQIVSVEGTSDEDVTEIEDALAGIGGAARHTVH